MGKEQKMHVLSVLLDEFAKSFWRDALMCWELSGDNDGGLVVILTVYERYTVTQRHLTELNCNIKSAELNTDINFRATKGTLEISIAISCN